MKRVFAAVEISDEARRAAGAAIESLRVEFGNKAARWISPVNLHITLRFFGDIDDDRLREIRDAAGNSISNLSGFSAELKGTGVFPRLRRPKVLWLGIDDGGGLEKLKSGLDAELHRAGFEMEDREYRPHLTIARLKDQRLTRTIAERHLALKFEPVRFSINRITVFQSILKPTGAEYTRLFESYLTE